MSRAGALYIIAAIDEAAAGRGPGVPARRAAAHQAPAAGRPGGSMLVRARGMLAAVRRSIAEVAGAAPGSARRRSRTDHSPAGRQRQVIACGRRQAPADRPCRRRRARRRRFRGQAYRQTRSRPLLYFSTCLIRAGAWNAYLPVLLPGRLPHLGRGRAALVTERDHVPVRHGRTGTTLREPVPGPGVARRTFLPGIDAGVGVRIAVIALADHAGSRVIRVWGPAAGHDVSASDEPGHPAGLYVRRCARSRKES